MTVLTQQELHERCVAGLRGAGFSPANAEAMAHQTVLAESLGQKSVGLSHTFDYIDQMLRGQIDAGAPFALSHPAPTIIHGDGGGGIIQGAFDAAFDQLVETARHQGLAMFVGNNTTLCASLGTFALRLAEAGLVGLAATNGSPLLAGSGGTEPVFCTNPMAFSAPQADGPPLLIDQSSSATAYVNIRAAADAGDSIPEGWALDADGNPTTDPAKALEGVMLAFGGARGANIALMVEILAGGLGNANWSVDAQSFTTGEKCSATGLFVLAINPEPAAPGFAARLNRYLSRLANDFGVHIPGISKDKHRRAAAEQGIDMDDALLARLDELAERQ